ncbi:MAG: DUF87 domain-containing protein [Planctomycetes bacterium]|nr:DUF87 domain-containing protein [Planctomycetota bacterium]MCW8134469.1 DUF87 domain-containing protein [Planctomycetota bacterium]
MPNRIEQQAALTVGTVEAVSPSDITVTLEIEAPQSVALNAGTPIPFPKINSYLLVPTQVGSIVGQVAWLGVEKSPYPKRKGLNDFGLVDLPYPLRRLKLIPIGVLKAVRHAEQQKFKMDRGLATFPSIGDAVLLPTEEQLRAVVETDPRDAKVLIGRSALADGTGIKVHPDKLFGRHLAVLGNTGSGKSCSVAGLVRWSLEAARNVQQNLNARFVILDPNGEYREAFKNLGQAVRVVTPHVGQEVAEGEPEVRPLVLPAWLWTTAEWAAILAAAPGVQQPLLIAAIRALRARSGTTASKVLTVAVALEAYLSQVKALIATQALVWANWNQRKDAKALLGSLSSASRYYAEFDDVSTNLKTTLVNLSKASGSAAGEIEEKGAKNFVAADALDAIESLIAEALTAMPDPERATDAIAESPTPFDVGRLRKTMLALATDHGDNRAQQSLSSLLTRLDTLLHDPRLKPILVPDTQPTLVELLRTYLGTEDGNAPQVVLVDLSLVPSDVMHIVVATLTRLLFEGLQRYHKIERHSLPTVVVLEEAHTFIQRGHDDPNSTPTPTQMCRRLFERVAREGRKFGMGMVLASQRPSEISPTVLSQCNTFLLHRLVNDDDQDLVRRLVPDSLATLFQELPVLPSQHAVLLGHASPVPKMLVMRDLPYEQRPRSDDPPFWKVWTEGLDHDPRIDNVANEWLGTQEDVPESPPEAYEEDVRAPEEEE